MSNCNSEVENRARAMQLSKI